MKVKDKPITTYKRKRDTVDNKISSDGQSVKSCPTEFPSSPISSPLQLSSPSSDITSSPSSQSSSQSSRPSQRSSLLTQSSPPSTPTKKIKQWDWWLAPKDNKQAKNTKTTPNKSKSSTPTKRKDVPRMEQMFLDLGQKNFDAKLCPECGMMYAPGVQEDSLMHTKFHAKHESIVNFPQWKSCRVVKEFAVGGGVICVGQDDTAANQSKVAKVRKLMDKELGYVDATNMTIEADQKIFLYVTSKNKVVGCVVAEQIEEAFHVIIRDHGHSAKLESKKEKSLKSSGTDDSSPSTPTKLSPSTPPTSTSPSSSQPILPSPSPKSTTAETDDLDLDEIMSIDTNKTKQKKVAESSENSKYSKLNKSEDSAGAQKKSDSSKKVSEAMLKKFSVSCGKEPQKAVCGITRSHRRQGIATKLLDAVRANMIYGYTVPKELCAFSQPTADGKLFFEIYRGTKEFLVYL